MTKEQTNQELRKLAEAATPINHDKEYTFFRPLLDIEPKLIDVPMSKSDVEFYAAANPQTILQLIKENEALREALNYAHGPLIADKADEVRAKYPEDREL